MEREIKGIQIEMKAKGIRIRIEADAEMKEKWNFFLEGTEPRHSTFEEIPEGIFIYEEENPEERILYYKNNEQTATIILNLILNHEELLKRKNRKVWVMIFNYLTEPGRVYAKTVEEINEKGEYTLKTVYLFGDETTGLLYNL